MIDFDQIEYMSAVWFVSGQGVDWMATLAREKGNPSWVIRYRYRYDAGGKDPFDGTDRKSFYCATAPPEESEEKLRKVLDDMAAMLAVPLRADIRDRIDVEGGASEFMAKAGGKPWVHVKADTSLAEQAIPSKRPNRA